MTQPFALTITLEKDAGYALAEALGFDGMSEALAVSIFDGDADQVIVQALYESHAEAEMARETAGYADLGIIEQMPNEDWVGLSQSGLAPIEAGRFYVHGSHDTPPADAPFPILVNAGQAFGTGHHGTTKDCLQILDALSEEGFAPDTILDLGTGAGILAIGAAKLFPSAKILATDIDPVAVDVAQENAALNNVRYDTLVADGFQTDGLKGRTFDLVIANILAGPLRGLAPEIAQAIAPEGQAILSGILDEQADWVAEAFQATGLKVEKRPSLDGWTSLRASK
ncbi:MAG: 50S ribosomal protein L11 methyltransferase [Pseudomonadota bacterium]